jgi:hypothetical protein
MSRLVKAFLDIALWRKTPASLPASTFLLALVACANVVADLLGDWVMPAPQGRIFLGVLLTVLAPLCFTWVVLGLTKRSHRFLQTCSAVLGIDVIFSLILLPLQALNSALGTDRPLSAAILALLSYAGLIAYLMATMNIWRSAVDSGLISAGLISLAYVMLQLVVSQELMAAR